MGKWVRGSCLTWGVNLSSHEWPISLSIAVSFHFTKEKKSYINFCKNSFHWKHYNTQWTEIPQYPMYIINQVFKVIYTVTSILNWSVLWASLSGGGIMVSGSGSGGLCVISHWRFHNFQMYFKLFKAFTLLQSWCHCVNKTCWLNNQTSGQHCEKVKLNRLIRLTKNSWLRFVTKSYIDESLSLLCRSMWRLYFDRLGTVSA